MCGRFVVSYTYDQLLQFISNTFDIFDLDPSFDVPRYNIAPGQDVISVIYDGQKYRIGELKWGFVPHYAKDEKMAYKMINARSETLSEKNAFKQAYKNQRCLILANGFYEWDKVTGSKKPYYITLNDQKMVAFAGLWSSYVRNDGSKLNTCTIVTTKANELVGDIHERMPVILDEESAKIWTDTSIKDSYVLESLFKPLESALMMKYRVSEKINKVTYTLPDSITEIVENTLL